MRKVLVIIPHYNRLILLKECLNHLDNQTSGDFEVMVVDNGSTDGSSEYIHKKANEDSKYHYILLSENMGFAYAVNRGFEYSIENHFDYSILLNNDAYIEDHFVSRLTDKMRTGGKRLFAASSLMLNYHKKDLVDSFGDNYNILGWAFQNKIGESKRTIFKDEGCFSACGGASIYNNELLKKVGFIDENYFAYLEDVDLSYRAKLMGYSISTCKDAVCYHLGSATTGSKYNEFKVKISARNSIYLIYKNMPLVQIVINILPLFLGIILKQIFFLVKGYGRSYFDGINEGLRTLYKIKKISFRKVSFFTYIVIEIELIINLIKYIINFIKRRLQ